MLTRERLRQLLSYDEDTGVFHWANPVSTAVRQGQIAGRKLNTGYWQIMVDSRRYQAHRLAWLWAYGEFPPNEIDHVNGDRSDNRLVNLRPATKAENQQNVGARKTNKCGFMGASPHMSGRWTAQIKHGGKKYYLGLYGTPEAAHAAYKAAKAELHTFQPTPRD